MFELVAMMKTHIRLQLTLWKSWLWCHRSCTPPLWRCPCTALSGIRWANRPRCGRLKCQRCFGPGGDWMAWNERMMQWNLGNREKHSFILCLNSAVAVDVALLFVCGSSQLLRPPRDWCWQLWQMLCNHPAEQHQLPMPVFKSLQHSQSALGPPNLMLTKTKLGCIYVVHLVLNITQTMHTPGFKLSVLVEFGHIKCSEYWGPLINPKCC